MNEHEFGEENRNEMMNFQCRIHRPAHKQYAHGQQAEENDAQKSDKISGNHFELRKSFDHSPVLPEMKHHRQAHENADDGMDTDPNRPIRLKDGGLAGNITGQ